MCKSSDDGAENVSLTLEYLPHRMLHKFLRGYNT